MTKPSYEIPNEVREFADKSVDQARKAFEGFAGAARKAINSVDATTANLQSGAKDVGAKAIANAEANVKAAFDHAQQLVRAKDVHEVLHLQSEYVKAQIAAIQEQAKELGAALKKTVTPKS
ncbi:MAG: phasin [Methylocystis sp.]|nr:phasin [Methylocystis sp.]